MTSEVIDKICGFRSGTKINIIFKQLRLKQHKRWFKMTKYIYEFGPDKTEGDASQKNL